MLLQYAKNGARPSTATLAYIDRLERRYTVRNGTPIGEDEPVFLLRAADRLFVPVVEFYASLVEQEKGEDPILGQLSTHIKVAKQWQEGNVTKLPDTVERI